MVYYLRYLFVLVFKWLWSLWTLDCGVLSGSGCVCSHGAGRDEVFVQGGRLMQPLPRLMQTTDTLTETQAVLVGTVHWHTTPHTHPGGGYNESGVYGGPQRYGAQIRWLKGFLFS